MRYANLRYRKNAPVHRENGAPEYYDTLDSLNAPTCVSGKQRIDLARACEILAAEFGVERMAVICVPELGVF